MIQGKLTYISGLVLCVDGVEYKATRGVRVTKGFHPVTKPIHLSDLKNGDTVQLFGPPKGDLHTINVR